MGYYLAKKIVESKMLIIDIITAYHDVQDLPC